MQGLLLVDKPIGWTSFDVVNYVRRFVAASEGKKPKNCKVGHSGTLDPLATGLLILLVGKEYTRRAAGLTKLDKTYQVTMKLGFTSTTADEEGAKSAVSSQQPSQAAIEKVLQDFSGELMQTPPVYSAMKINGQRAYKLARAGQTVELAPRPVTVYRNQLVAYEYPFVHFTSEVSSGTYIRSLVTDIGENLATGAYMSDLRRTQIGDYSVTQAVQTTGLNADTIASALQEL